MAVPKKRTGKSAQGHRRSNWKATKPETTKCSNCGTLTLTHTVCESCGFYKGKAVSRKSPDFTEAAAAPKAVKAKKPAAKKAKTEAPVETKAEETEVTETPAKPKAKKAKAEAPAETPVEEKVEETTEVEAKAEEVVAEAEEENKAE